MDFAAWCTFAGLMLVSMALVASVVERLPLSSSMLYLAVGVATSPLWLGWTQFEPLPASLLLERLAEVVVVLSLFTSGMKMGIGLTDGRWKLPVRLALLSMVVTVALVAAAGHWLLGLPIGAAVLLGAVLAPTDPVLAAEVQLAHHGDRDRLRFSLTGEAGLNDGTAFPFVMLGLGLLGLHEIGNFGWRWLAVDLLWAVAAGLAVGAAVALLVGRLVLHLRRTHREAVGLDEFLTLGVIALSYGLALQLHAYGFLAVFAAGVALRQMERRESAAAAGSPDAAVARADVDSDHAEQVAVHPKHAPAFMARAMLGFNEQIERVGEVIAVVAVGMLLWTVQWHWAVAVFVLLALFAIRPAAVAVGMAGSPSDGLQRALIAWFGIRGIGSLYYLMYAVNHGVANPLAAELISITFVVIATSIVLHGLSVKPLIGFYERVRRQRSSSREVEATLDKSE